MDVDEKNHQNTKTQQMNLVPMKNKQAGRIHVSLQIQKNHQRKTGILNGLENDLVKTVSLRLNL